MKAKTYHEWFLHHQRELEASLEAQGEGPGSGLSAEVVRYSHLKNYILSGEGKPDVLIACDDDGELADCAVRMICDFFAENPRINMVYADEDQISEGVHISPWFKADWSPDTFLSTFYFGSIFALRSSALALINPGKRTAQEFESESRILEDAVEEQEARRTEPDSALSSWIYGKLCLKVAQADGGFSKRRHDRMPVGHIPEILFHAYQKPEAWDANLIRDSLTGRYSKEAAQTRLISIIIPSKDNPELLFRCVHSIMEHVTVPYELIIVDNGSSEVNRRKTQALIDEINAGDMSATYLYKEMDFNMARMNNMGAACANGEMLLFLHDDVVVRKLGWLSHLSEKAKLPYVGAVGMKLLYPDSNIIQHAGIVSVRAGRSTSSSIDATMKSGTRASIKVCATFWLSPAPASWCAGMCSAKWADLTRRISRIALQMWISATASSKKDITTSSAIICTCSTMIRSLRKTWRRWKSVRRTGRRNWKPCAGSIPCWTETILFIINT